MVNGALLRGQIRRGLLSIRFLLVLALAVFMAVFQWWTMRHAGYRLPYHQPTFLDETLLFSTYGSGTTLYQFLFPFLAALAGGSTLAVERRSGRLTFLQARSSYGVVERTSLCSGFLLGALGGVLPYVMSVLLAAAGNPHLSFIDGVESTDVDVASFQFILISSEGWIYPIYRSADDGAVRLVRMHGRCYFAVCEASERGSAGAGRLPAAVVDASGDNPASLHMSFLKPCGGAESYPLSRL